MLPAIIPQAEGCNPLCRNFFSEKLRLSGKGIYKVHKYNCFTLAIIAPVTQQVTGAFVPRVSLSRLECLLDKYAVLQGEASPYPETA